MFLLSWSFLLMLLYNLKNITWMSLHRTCRHCHMQWASVLTYMPVDDFYPLLSVLSMLPSGLMFPPAWRTLFCVYFSVNLLEMSSCFAVVWKSLCFALFLGNVFPEHRLQAKFTFPWTSDSTVSVGCSIIASLKVK